MGRGLKRLLNCMAAKREQRDDAKPEEGCQPQNPRRLEDEYKYLLIFKISPFTLFLRATARQSATAHGGPLRQARYEKRTAPAGLQSKRSYLPSAYFFL